MKQTMKNILCKVPFVRRLRERIEILEEGVKKQGEFQAGHYYSTIPLEEDVVSYVKSKKALNSEVLGVNLNKENQLSVLKYFVDLYGEMPFPEKQSKNYRYYFDNGWFCYSDAIFLYSFLRKYVPKKIVEVGSGFSSAVMLDTIDGFFPKRPEVTFVEPYPDRLVSLFRDGDREKVGLIDKKVQDVSEDIFLSLEAGDLLFIDSSHVVKCGSDLQFLMFDILPRLKPGVFVHFHDVFFPFDYPSEWLLGGRYWNETYFLRAFLSFNSDWSVEFFNTYAHFMFGDLIQDKMPLCTKNTGGSLYIKREK